MQATIETIRNAVIAGKRADIHDLVSLALNRGLDPKTILNDALIATMDVVGQEFGSGRIFVPEMLVAAVTMKWVVK